MADFDKAKQDMIKEMEYDIPNVVDFKYVMDAIQKYEQQPDHDINGQEACKLRRILYRYITEDMINTVAHKYLDIYIDAVKSYMRKNDIKKVEDLLEFFGDKSYGAEFFPDFISFIINHVMNALSIKNGPKIQFVKSGETFSKYVKNSDEKEISKIEKTATAFYDDDVNTIFFKEDRINDFDTFINNLAHEISHAVDFLDATKGVFKYKVIQEYSSKLYSLEDTEYKHNAEEKSAMRIGVVIGKNFTRKLKESLEKDNLKMMMEMQQFRKTMSE